jgi:hypothetical protein
MFPLLRVLSQLMLLGLLFLAQKNLGLHRTLRFTFSRQVLGGAVSTLGADDIHVCLSSCLGEVGFTG